MVIVSEPGVFRLIFTSRKAEAEEFKKWLAHEVLPSIRKTGRYEAAPKDGEVLPPLGEKRQFPDWPLEEMRTKRGVVDMYRMTWGPQSSQWIAPQLGFPQPPPHLIETGRQMALVFPEAAE